MLFSGHYTVTPDEFRMINAANKLSLFFDIDCIETKLIV